ncbi:MAG: hypothetical protein II707_01710 [Spirochaetales bacterium]|nr:hypothetical protein [Spirochaetales bacterium]
MLKKTTKLIIAILLASLFVGCPTTESGSESSNNNDKITSLQAVINSSNDGDTINLSQYPDITNYNATINKAVTINGSQTSLNGAALTVEKDATISGITNASVTASSSLGNGSLKIASSSLSSLTINGGGINSIVVTDVSVDDVIIAKTVANNSTNQYVRFCVDAATKIKNLALQSNALIDVAANQSFNTTGINITFADSDTMNVAFNNNINMATPSGKARANFDLDCTGVNDFFIIVPNNKPIQEDFFEKVSEKFYKESITAYNKANDNEIDFNTPINNTDGEVTFIGKPAKTVLFGGSNFYVTEDLANKGEAAINDSNLGSYRFCLDNSGDLYVLKVVANGIYGDKSYILSNKEGFETIEFNDVKLKSIAFDRKTSTLYAKDENNKIYKHLADSNVEYSITTQYDAELYSDCFAVDNGIVYTTYISSDKQELLKIDLSQATGSDNNKTVTQTVLKNELLKGYAGEITDILYQEGVVYMLLSDVILTKSNTMTFGSHGAVIEYKIEKNEISYHGWTDTPLDNTNKYLCVFYGGYYLKNTNSDNAFNLLMKADDLPKQNGKSTFNLYAPMTSYTKAAGSQSGTWTYDNAHFYGPKRFLAIRPKKLVIADSGIAYYTDDDVFNLKQINRVVTVNLEDFAMQCCDTDVKFTNEYPSTSSGYFTNGYLTANDDWLNTIPQTDLYLENSTKSVFNGNEVYWLNNSGNWEQKNTSSIFDSHQIFPGIKF